jgi:predicted metalloprotease with PDZ domain
MNHIGRVAAKVKDIILPPRHTGIAVYLYSLMPRLLSHDIDERRRLLAVNRPSELPGFQWCSVSVIAKFDRIQHFSLLFMIHYTITPLNPAAHLFQVVLIIAKPDSTGQQLRLPAWIPGSYKIRDFAKNITSIYAESLHSHGVSHLVELTQLDKHTWQAAAIPKGASLKVSCQVYAYDVSVRTAYLDNQQALFNFSSLCLSVVGQASRPCQVTLLPPPCHTEQTPWQVVSSLPPHKDTALRAFGDYYAPNYDALIDYPVMLAPVERICWGDFIAHGATHNIAIVGKVHALDMPRLIKDTANICAAHIALFEPISKRAPFVELDPSAHYTFMTMVLGEGYGGLEHRASTALMCKRSDLPSTLDSPNTLSAGYQQYLGLMSHEYFHTWNVKRIKPAVFAPYDLTQENYTPLLWLFEGFTAYYDDLMLVRAGITTPQQYLNSLAHTLNNVRRTQGRLVQSAANASLTAWVKYYNPDENSPNALASYYTQGSLIAAYLDVYIRLNTENTEYSDSPKSPRSLDDVMRLLWQRFGRDFYTENSLGGVTMKDIYTAFDEATRLQLTPLIERLIHTPHDIPLEDLLPHFGVVWAQEATSSASLGAATRSQGTEVVLACTYAHEAAQNAGLSGADVLIALDGLRVTPNSLPVILARLAPHQTVRALAWRRDELVDTMLTLDAAKTVVTLTLALNVPMAQSAERWLCSQ